MTRARSFVFLSCVALTLLLTAPATLARTTPEAEPGEPLERLLAAAEEQLRAGEWQQAGTLAQEVLLELAERGEADERAATLAARGAFVHAVAAAGLGSEEDALWYWWTAQLLDPGLRGRPLDEYGDAGAFLDAHRARDAGEVPEGAGVLLAGRGSTAFVPAQPRLTAVPGLLGNGLPGLVLELIVDADGRSSEPVVIERGELSPLAAAVAFGAVRHWRFEPATLDGEPVADLVRVSGFRATGGAGIDWSPSDARVEEARRELGLDRLDRLALQALERVRWDPPAARCLWESSSLTAAEREHEAFAELRRQLAAEAARYQVSRPPRLEQVDQQDVSAPRKIYSPQPLYTDVARQKRVEGTVVVLAILATDGRVHSVEVKESLPHGLDEAAIGAVCGWRFVPAEVDGTPVDVYYNLTVNFSLE